MLTKEHLNFRIRQGKITPLLLSPTDTALLSYLEQLLAFFSPLVGQRLNAFDRSCQSAGLDQHPMFLPMRKLLLGLLTYQEDDTCAARRWQTLLHAQQLRAEELFPTSAGFQETMAQNMGMSFDDIAADLYSDLPENQLVKSLETISPEALIARYNCAQVQGLLIYSHEVELTVEQAGTDEIRGLFRALRFHRLLGEITSGGDLAHAGAGKKLTMTISGPLGLFQQNLAGYALRVAHFFPHIVHLPSWSLKAMVSPPNKKKELELQISSRLGLSSHYKQQLSYLPEEFQLLISGFNEKNQDWVMSTSGECLNLGRENYCIADFVFVHTGGTQVHLELFHKWHWRQIPARIKAAELTQQKHLLVGVCRSVSTRKEIAEVLANSAWYTQYGFIFREFPTSKNLNSMLAKVATI
jgi:predicted nuclease of restriction endonuclease-like RecB superfamily